MPFPPRTTARLVALALAVAPAFVSVGGVMLASASLQAQEAATTSIAFADQALLRDYTGQAMSINPATDLVVSPGSSADYTFKITYAGKTTVPKNAGSYAVKVVATSIAPPTRSATVTGTLVIRKAQLLVLANDQVRFFGAANPALTLSYDGFVNGETVSVIDRRPAAKTLAKTTSAAGDYDITVSGGSDNNYELFGYNTGRLTILPAFPGTYESFIYEIGSPSRPVGKLILTLPAKGSAFTGRLELASEGAGLTLSGKLLPAPGITGATGSVLRKTPASEYYRVDFSVSGEGILPEIFFREKGGNEDVPVFTLSPVTRITDLTGRTPSPAGAYTFALLNPASDDFLALTPGGLGFATGTVSTNGTLKLTGRFADGTTLSASVAPDHDLRYRLFLRPYGSRKNSYAAGDFVLQPHPDADRLEKFYVPATALHSLLWTKAKSTGKADALFSEGFGLIDNRIVMDPWIPPAKAKAATSTAPAVPAAPLARRLGLVEDPAYSGYAGIAYGPEDLGFSTVELPRVLEFTTANKALPLLDDPPANPRAWKITSLNTSTGLFSGSFKLTDTDFLTYKVYTRTVTFQGVLRQAPLGDTTLGAGYFILKDLPNAFEPTTRSVDIRFVKE